MLTRIYINTRTLARTLACSPRFTRIHPHTRCNTRGMCVPYYVSHLRVRVDDAWNRVIVHVAVRALDRLDGRDALLLRLVREHGPVDHVPDREHARDIRAELVVHGHAAHLILLHAQLREAEAGSKRAATRRDQHNVERLGSGRAALGGLSSQRNAARRVYLRLGDLRAQLELEALLREDALEHRPRLRVHTRRDAVQVFNDRHLGAQSPPHGPHFQPNHARADHGHLRRDGLEHERARAIHDLPRRVVHGHGGQRRGLAAGCDDDVLRGDFLRARAAGQGHGHLTRLGDLARTLHVVHLARPSERYTNK